MTEPDHFLLTTAQKGIWLGQCLDPETPAYWAAEYLELHGALQQAAWQDAVVDALNGTEALHQRHVRRETEIWQHAAASRSTHLQFLDFSRDADPGAAAERWMREDLQRAVDLTNGPLFSTALLRLGHDRHYWYFSAHHIALDGYAFKLVEKRVVQKYTDALAGHVRGPAAAACMREVSAEDERYRASPAFANDAAFWRAKLSDAPDPVSVGARCPLARSVLRMRLPLAAEALLRLKATANASRVPWTSWLLAIVAAWLERETGAVEHVLGMPVTGRFGSVGATLPCMMMNIVPVRIRVDPCEPLGDLAARVEAELRGSRAHQRYRYEDMKRELALHAHGRRLFGTVVNLMPFEAPVHVGALSISTHPLSAGPVEDLALGFAENGQTWRLDLEANPEAYDHAALRRIERSLRDALEGNWDFANCSAQALFASTPVPESIVHAEPLVEPPLDVLQQFLEHATSTPSQLAVAQEGQASLDYAELRRRVGCLAHVLTAAGVGPEQRVAILLARSPDAIIAQLAVLWAGAAYVPIDPDGPPERIALVLELAGPSLLIVSAHQQKHFGQHETLRIDEDLWLGPQQLEPTPVSPSTLAYVIFTSGSTGKPNGVMIERGALAHFTTAARRRYAMTEADRVLQFAPLQFDASVEEIFVTLCSGATLLLRTGQMLESLTEFVSACARLSLTVLDLPTAFWHELTPHLSQSGSLPASVRLTIIGGEAALPERVARFRAAVGPRVALLNTYGPTETTVVFTTATLSESKPLEYVSIGRPLAGLSIAIVDEALRPVPNGKQGELCLIGPTLARGYLGREDLSALRFVTLKHLPGAPRGYLSGDRAFIDASGMLSYVGRKDDELKISGYRVSPLEVETALLDVPGVEAAAVFGDSSVAGRTRLVACCAGKASALSPAALRATLAERLSPQAIPSLFVRVASLPRDANGKVDRKALKALVRVTQDDADAPLSIETSPRARIVSAVFAEVLGVPITSTDADFFELGGHSLLALQAAERLSRALEREVPLSLIFRSSSVSALCRALDESDQRPMQIRDPLAPVIHLNEGSGPALFCVHPADGLAWCYAGLARYLPQTRIIGLQAPGLIGEDPPNFEALVSHYLLTIRTLQTDGPYRLLGWSSGGGIAHAIAVELQRAGKTVSVLAMLDAYPADIWHGTPEPTREDALVSMLDELDASPMAPDGRRYDSAELLARLKRPGGSLSMFPDATLWRMCDVAWTSMRSYRRARHALLEGDVLFFRAQQRPPSAPDHRLWANYLTGKLECVDIDAGHLGMCQPRSLQHIARVLTARL